MTDFIIVHQDKENQNATDIRVLKKRDNADGEFRLYHPFRYEETPEQRAKRELGFPIEGIEP